MAFEPSTTAEALFGDGNAPSMSEAGIESAVIHEHMKSAGPSETPTEPAPTEPAPTPEPTPTPTPAPTPEPTPLTPDSIAQATTRAILEASKKAEEDYKAAESRKPVAPPSVEEIKKIFQVFEPTQDHVQAILEGGEGAVKAMNEVVARTVLQATKMAELQTRKLIDEAVAPLGGVRDYVQQQQEAKWRDDFFKQNPHLQKVGKVLQKEVDRLRSTGAQFNTIDEAFAHLKKFGNDIYTDLGIDPATMGAAPAPTAPNGQPNGTPAPARRKPASTGPGSGGGSSSPSPSGTEGANKTAEFLFGR